jgi:sodium transport system permease protein
MKPIPGLLAIYRIVFRKELRELFRDRRALFWLFAPPILLPGLALCAGLFVGFQAVRIASEGFPVIIQNAEQAPELVAYFEAEEGLRLLPETGQEEDIFGEAVVVVGLPEDFQAQLAQGQTVSVQLFTQDDSIISFLGRASARGVIDRYSQEVLSQRLAEAGLTQDWLTPVVVGERRIATGTAAAATEAAEEEQEGGSSIFAAIFLPLAVTSWLLGGGMGLVLDTTVGEKDRQTIENLLVTPANRVGIVLGKMTVVFIASLMVMSLWLAEGIALNALTTASPELSSTEITSTQTLNLLVESSQNILGLVGALVVLIIPFTILLNALMMAWCAYASNYREANLVMALLQLGLPASVLLTIFSFPAEVSLVVYGLPFLGTIVAIRDLFSTALSTEGLLLCLLSGLAYAALGVWFAAWMFGREWSLTRGLQ